MACLFSLILQNYFFQVTILNLGNDFNQSGLRILYLRAGDVAQC
jgi:hypothetical protein